MANIDIDAIMSKVKDWKESDEGRKRVADYIDDRRKNGNGEGIGGIGSGDTGVIIDEKTMSWVAEELIRILKEVAFGKSLPKSVLSHFDSLRASAPQRLSGGEYYSIDIDFTDYLGRLSLYSVHKDPSKNRFTGNGINNIVALFDTGYDATDKKPVYGEWDGHEELGIIKGRQKREGLRFIEEAIDIFNKKFEAYGVNAYIMDKVYAVND